MNKDSHNLRLITLLIFTSLIAACSSTGPGDVAKKFMTHISKFEFAEAKPYATEQTGQLVEMMGKMGASMGAKMKKDENFSFVLEDEKIDGDKATVRFRKTSGGKIQVVHLIKVKGDWKVHEEKK